MLQFRKKSFLAGVCILSGMLVSLCSCGKPEEPALKSSNEKPSNGNAVVPCTSSTDDGYYYSDDRFFQGGRNLCYIDYQSKAEVFLCGNPNCSHNSEECTSFYPYDGKTLLMGVIAEGDHLLAIQCIGGEQSKPHIDCLDLQGGFESRLIEFSNEQQLPGSVAGEFYTDHQDLFFVMQDIDGETTTRTYSVVKVNLQTGQLESLYQTETGNVQIALCGSFERKLILRTLDANTSGNEFQYILLDVDSKGTKELHYDFDEDTAMEVKGPRFYRLNSADDSITVDDIATGEQQTCSVAAITEQVEQQYGEIHFKGIRPLSFTDRYCKITYNVNGPQDEWQEVGYLVDLKTGENQLFTLYETFRPNTSVSVLAELPDQLLVQKDFHVKQCGNEERYLPQFALLSKEDYLRSEPDYQLIEGIDSAE